MTNAKVCQDVNIKELEVLVIKQQKEVEELEEDQSTKKDEIKNINKQSNLDIKKFQKEKDATTKELLHNESALKLNLNLTSSAYTKKEINQNKSQIDDLQNKIISHKIQQVKESEKDLKEIDKELSLKQKEVTATKSSIKQIESKIEQEAKAKSIKIAHKSELEDPLDLTITEQKEKKIANISLSFHNEFAVYIVTLLLKKNLLSADFPLILSDKSQKSIMGLYCKDGEFFAQDPISPIVGEYPINLKFKNFKLTVTNIKLHIVVGTYFTTSYFNGDKFTDNLWKLGSLSNAPALANEIINILASKTYIGNHYLYSITQSLFLDITYGKQDIVNIVLERRDDIELEKASNEAVKYFSDFVKVLDGTKLIVVNTKTNVQIPLEGFKKQYKNKTIKVLKHTTGKYTYPKIVELWDESNDVYLYQGFTWDPSNAVSKSYNTWIEFNGNPSTELDVALYDDFILNTMYSGNQVVYTRYCAYMAQVVQDPTNKIGSAIIVISNNEEVKDTFFRSLQNIFAGYYSKRTDKSKLTKVDEDFKKSIMLEIDEALTVGEKAVVSIDNFVRDNVHIDTSKSLTERTKTIARCIINAKTHAFASKIQKRGRYMLTDCDNSITEDRQKMDELHKLIVHEDFAATMIKRYKEFDYTPYLEDITNMSEPILSDDEKMEGWSEVELWWYDFIQTDNLVEDKECKKSDDKIRITKRYLHKLFLDDTKGKLTMVQFGTKMTTILKKSNVLILDVKEPKIGGITARDIKHISECKTAFEKYYNLDSSINN